MKSIWEASLDGNVITVENNWFSGERLYVNNQLQDYQISYFSPPILHGHLLNIKKEKLQIRANILQGFLGINCILFVDDVQVPLKKVK